MSDDRATTGGEKPAYRDARDRMAAHLVETAKGQMSPEKARKIATDAALRADGTLPGGATKR